MDYATVVSVEVGPSSVGNEPATTAVLRDDAGNLTTVRILGGPNASGGVTRLAGYVVPMMGARVRIDLREDPPPPSDRAWVAAGPKWPASAFPLSYYLALPGSRDVGLEAGSELDIATRSWSTVSCTNYRAKFSGTTMNPPGNDGLNVIYFHDTMWPTDLTPKGLAQSVLHTNSNNEIVDADVHVNGVDYTWSLEGAGAVPDVRAILTHELGHSLGLAHSTVLNATMYATYSGGIAWRALKQDDRDGVCALYPGNGAPGCDQNPCPGGFLCIAKTCERKGAQGVICAPCNPNDPKACAGEDGARCVDYGAGALLCGRACAVDGDCGAGFHCKPTTSSGDLQCLSDSVCANGPDTCAKDSDCKIGKCMNGVCVGVPAPVDAGADAKGDGGNTPVAAGGCTCNQSSSASNPWAAFLAFFLVRRRRFLARQ